MTRSSNVISTISNFSNIEEMSQNGTADPQCKGNDNLAFETQTPDENGQSNGNTTNSNFEFPARKAPSAALRTFRRAARTVGVSVKVVGVWNNFAQQTTIHGVRMITEKNIYKLRREIWLFLVLTGVGLFLYQLLERSLYYNSNPVALNVKVTYNETIQFPAVTICNQNSFRLSKTMEKGMYKALQEMYSRPLHEFDFNKHEIGNVSLQDIFSDFAHTRDDMILSCSMNGVQCKQAFSPVLTDHGLCYTFNGDAENIIAESSAGSDQGLRLLLNAEQYEYMAGPHEGTGVKVLVHSAQEIPSVNDAGISLQTGYSNLIATKVIKVENLPEPYGKCQPNLHLDNFDHYTLGNCNLECTSAKSQEFVGCVLPHMVQTYDELSRSEDREDFPVCSVEEYVTKYIARDSKMARTTCNCPLPCDSVQHEPSVTYAKILTKQVVESLDANVIENIRAKFLNSLEKQQIVKESIVQEDVMAIERFLRMVSVCKAESASVKDVMISTADYLSEMKMTASARSQFHNKWGLEKQNILIYEGQIRGWETQDETTFQFVTRIYKEFGSVFLNMVEILTSNQDEAVVESWKSETMRDIQDRQYMTQMAIEMFKNYHTAFEQGSLVNELEIEITPEGYFDSSYSIKNLLVDPKIERQIYKAVWNVLNNYTSSLEKLSNFSLSYFETINFTQSQFDDIFIKFVEESETYNELRFGYKTNVVYKSFDKLDSLQEQFQQRNSHFLVRMTSCRKAVDKVLEKLSEWRKGILPKLIEVREVSEEYIKFNGTSKRHVAEMITEPKKMKLVKDLKTSSRDLRVLGIVITDNIKQLKGDYLALVEFIRSSPGLQGFYRDVGNVIINETDSARSNMVGDSQGFQSLNTMLNGTMTNFDANDTQSVLPLVNADLFIELEAFEAKLNREIQKMTEDVQTVIRFSDNFDLLTTTLSGLQERMEGYLKQTKMTNKFYGDNFIRLNVFLPEMSFENRIQDRIYDEFALICDIGGSLGLFVGASFMTFFEIIDAGLRWLARHIKVK